MIKITLVIVSIALFGFGTYYASEAVRIRRRVMSKLSQSSDLSKIYTFRKPSEVSEFLRDNHFLIPVPDLKATNSFSRISDSGDLLRISSRLIQIWYHILIG